jgi:Family of unknown function (DUF6459)
MTAPAPDDVPPIPIPIPLPTRPPRRRPRYPTIAETTDVLGPPTFPAPPALAADPVLAEPAAALTKPAAVLAEAAAALAEPAVLAEPTRPAPAGEIEFGLAPPCEPAYDHDDEGGELHIDTRLAAAPDGSARYAGAPRYELPPPKQWLDRLLMVVLECLEGWRPVVQLRGHASALVIGGLLARIRLGTHRPGGVPRIRSIHVTEPAPGIVEACAVVSRVGRVQAIAIRMEAVSGRWRCTSLHILD